MKIPAIVLAGAIAFATAAVHAASNDESRTYANPACSERNANPNDCVIQNGPPRRSAFGQNSPPVKKGPDSKSGTGSESGNGVTVLGAPGSAKK
jgi:hypothetical protein